MSSYLYDEAKSSPPVSIRYALHLSKDACRGQCMLPVRAAPNPSHGHVPQYYCRDLWCGCVITRCAQQHLTGLRSRRDPIPTEY